MKLTKSKLKQIIKEEYKAVMTEALVSKDIALGNLLAAVTRREGKREQAIMATLKFLKELDAFLEHPQAKAEVDQFRQEILQYGQSLMQRRTSGQEKNREGEPVQ